jgi:hypothetical protein
MSTAAAEQTAQQPWYQGVADATPGSQDDASTVGKVKTAGMGASIGGGVLMALGGYLFLKTVRSTPKEQRKPGKTLIRTAAVLSVAAGASMVATGGAVYAGAKAIENRPMVKALIG